MKTMSKFLFCAALLALAACATDPNDPDAVQQLAPGCDAPSGQVPGDANANPLQSSVQVECEKQSEREHGR